MIKRITFFRFALFILAVATASLFLLCSSDSKSAGGNTVVSSHSYSGHESDMDANNFVTAYPSKVGTRLDDCQTCHRAGVAGTSTSKIYNPCSYCHLRKWQDPTLTDGVPANFTDTLNAYGLAYKNAGQTTAALLSIGSQDSDGDGYTNDAEIVDNRFPGSDASKPGQPMSAIKTITNSDFTTLMATKKHEQFLLMNTNKQQFDDYATYGGVKVSDLLVSLGIDLADANITGITVYAPDGFSKDFTKTNITTQYPDETFYSVPQPFGDPAMDLVNYESPLPAGIADQDPLQNLWLMIASTRGASDTPLSISYYDSSTGKQEGEGPFRIIPPQKTVSKPDRGSKALKYNDGWDYIPDGPGEDRHNAGSSVRGMCIIRINPLPAGYEEYDTSNGWSLITDKKIIVYGYGIN